MNNHDVFDICLTGGPCAGKTETIERLKKISYISGYRVLLVPEISTLLDTYGMSHEDGQLLWQGSIFNAQVFFDKLYHDYAEGLDEDVVIIHDRGLHDAQVYTDSELFSEFCKKHDISDVYSRYDCVIHLVSVAYDKPYCYNMNNKSRREESVEEAAEREIMTRKISYLCDNYHIVSNEKCNTFEDKYSQVFSLIEEQIRGRKNELVH